MGMKIVKLNSSQFDKFASMHRYRNYYQTSMYANVMNKFGYHTQFLGVVNDENKLIGATLLLYKEVLGQPIWEKATAGIKKIEPSTWYTFSFYAKGIGCTTYIYPSCVDTSADFFIDGVKQETVPGDAAKAWTFTSNWVRHTVTFKTKSSFYNSV